MQIPININTLLYLLHAALHLRPREVLIPGVDRLELTAIDRHAGIGEQLKLAADLVVRGEDPAEFTRVLESLIDELQPQGSLEEQLVERVAACMTYLPRTGLDRLREFLPVPVP